MSLQIADMMANACDREGGVLYVSGEESVNQVKMRSDRLGLKANGLYLANETDIEKIISMVETLDTNVSCKGVVVDSIQTTFSNEINSPAGKFEYS